MVGTILKIRYELTQELYQHPLFTCYAARDRVAGVNVSIRLIRPEVAKESAFIAKLRDVILHYKILKHPYIEAYIDFDQHEGNPFIVAELFKGQLLSERIKKLAPFSPHLSVATSLCIAEALQAIHKAGLVHGDVSPYNVICSKEGGIKLILAGMWETYSCGSLIVERMLPRMAPYLAPEVHVESLPNPLTDLYSLGVVMHELITGHVPYSADTLAGMILKHSTAPVPSLRARNPATPTVLDDVVRKNLAKEPKNRYESAQAFCEDLKIIQEALRFGRSAHLKHLNRPANRSIKVPEKIDPEGTKVAPKMSAIRQPKSIRRAKPKKLDSDQFSKLLTTGIYGCAVLLVFMIGGWIYFNLSKPRLVKVPNLVRLNLSEANLRLQDMHLGLKISRRESSDQYPEGTILDVNPAPGEHVKENSCVFVTVSSGSRFVEVPDVRGLSVPEAKSLLENVNLSVEEPGQRVKSLDTESGKIVNQIPEARNKIERYSKVRVQVSGGPHAGSPATLMTGEKHQYTVRVKMPIVISKILVRVDMTDDRGTRTIYEQLHGTNDAFDVKAEGYGKQVIFRIFGDGELVEQIQKSPPVPENTSDPLSELNDTEPIEGAEH